MLLPPLLPLRIKQSVTQLPACTRSFSLLPTHSCSYFFQLSLSQHVHSFSSPAFPFLLPSSVTLSPLRIFSSIPMHSLALSSSLLYHSYSLTPCTKKVTYHPRAEHALTQAGCLVLPGPCRATGMTALYGVGIVTHKRILRVSHNSHINVT